MPEIGKPVELTVVDTNKAGWQDLPIPYLGVNLDTTALHDDPETGMWIIKLKYRAGFTNPWHRHYCGHGFYVLEGVLDTHQGQYGPGSWVWFPEGGVMYHGATKEQDCTALFVTNKKFTIHFVGDKNDPCAMEMDPADQK